MYPSIETLQDDFNGAVLDSSKWIYNAGDVSVHRPLTTGYGMRLPLGPNTIVETAQLYNAQNSTIMIKIGDIRMGDSEEIDPNTFHMAVNIGEDITLLFYSNSIGGLTVGVYIWNEVTSSHFRTDIIKSRSPEERHMPFYVYAQFVHGTEGLELGVHGSTTKYEEEWEIPLQFVNHYQFDVHMPRPDAWNDMSAMKVSFTHDLRQGVTLPPDVAMPTRLVQVQVQGFNVDGIPGSGKVSSNFIPFLMGF